MFSLPCRAAAATAALALAGCAGFSPDGGLGPVRQAASDRLGRPVELGPHGADAARRSAELLAAPLTPDGAVQLALLHNPGLQADLATVGLGEAELVQANRLPNPGFGFARTTRGDALEIDRSLTFSLARLLTLPLATRSAARHYERSQREATLRVLQLASDTRRAWVEAVAAEQGLAYARQVAASAEAGAELAGLMVQAGHWTVVEQAREDDHRSAAQLALAQAGQARTRGRERLARLIGLDGPADAFTLPDRLPELPAAPRSEPSTEQAAIDRRLDVQAAKLAAEQTASDLGLVRTTRVVNVLDVGALRNSYNDGGPAERGWEVSLELPLFDFGSARVRRAELVYGQAVARTAETAQRARSEVRERWQAWLVHYRAARHYRDEVVPRAKRVSDEQLLRYNGMLIGVFDLLADARMQVSRVQAALDAQRDFWLADAALEDALTGTAPDADPRNPTAGPTP